MEALEPKPWGVSEYTVRDPDGYRLRFAGSGRTKEVSHAQPAEVRIEARLPTRAELEAFAAKDPEFKYICTCSREPQTGGEADWQGLRGRVNIVLEPATFRRLAGFDLAPHGCHVFLCGNPAMIDEVSAELSGRGFTPRDREHPDGNVHLEKYW